MVFTNGIPWFTILLTTFLEKVVSNIVIIIIVIIFLCKDGFINTVFIYISFETPRRFFILS
jgi:hypothetical protein